MPIDDEIKKLYQDYMDLRDEVEKKKECEPFIFISANGKNGHYFAKNDHFL